MKKLNYLLLIPFIFFGGQLSLAQNSVTGSWSPVYTGDMIPVACANLPDGNILAWSARDRYNFGGNAGRTYTSIYNTSNNTFSTSLTSNTNHDMFCPGIANIGNGEVVITGGSSSDKTTIYNPANNSFRAGSEMNTARGYHAMCTLDDGRVFTVGGSWSGGRFNKNAEVWSANTGWLSLGGVNSNNTVRQGAPDPGGIYRDDNHAWLWATPGGRVFQAGPGTDMHWISTTGSGNVTDVGKRGTSAYSMNGNSVMYDVGKILVTGGAVAYSGANYPATERSYTIDISNNSSAVVNRRGNMNQGRVFHNSVVLPSGEVVVTGGQCSPQPFKDDCARLNAEIWNPATGAFRQLAAMQTPRTYHSVSLLMQDGRVWVAGGGLCGNCSTNHPNAEIFSPPYLFAGNALATRPIINNAPSTADYNTTINVQTNTSIDEFVIVRMSSATHSVNNEQRRIPLTATNSGGNNYRVNIPARGWVPPGNYFLFAMKNGVPSVATVIRVGSNTNAGGGSQLVANGTYYIVSSTTGQHVASPSFDNNNVRMLDAGTETDRRWEITHVGSDVYNIKNLRTNRYLNVSGNECRNGANIITSPNAVANNSRWIISKTGNDYFFRPVHCTSRALDKRGGVNQNVHTWAYSTGNNNQRFRLNNVSNSGSGGNTLTNHIAVGKPTTQSSNYRGAIAARAVDGNTDGNYRAGSVTHTNEETAWWRVDLEGTFNISAIRIHNRTDCCSSRLNNVSVYIGNINSTNPNDYTRIGNLNSDAINAFQNVNRQARYVMIRRNNRGFLSLAEVEVQGTPTTGTTVNHIAVGKPATQSSNYKGAIAARAVDGNSDGNYRAGSVTHTNEEISWWRVDLENAYDISSIRVHNRTDCCSSRLNNVSLYVGNINSTNPNDYTRIGNLNGNSVNTFQNINQRARYVLVRRNNNGFLSLAEVEVQGTLTSEIDPRSLDLANDLRATPMLGQQTALTWYAVNQNTHLPIKAYTFQHLHEEEEDFVDLETVQVDNHFSNEIAEFTHTNPKVGNNYYQVKIEYVDGSVDYSNYQVVAFVDKPAKISIAPNPAQYELRIDLSNYMETPLYYFVASSEGNVVAQGDFTEQHAEIESINLTTYKDGQYFLYLRPRGAREMTTSFVVTKL